jgi:hypothetical protein
MAFTEKTVSWVGGLVLKTEEQKSSFWFQNIPLINWTILFVFASMLKIQPFLKAWTKRLGGGQKQFLHFEKWRTNDLLNSSPLAPMPLNNILMYRNRVMGVAATHKLSTFFFVILVFIMDINKQFSQVVDTSICKS